MAWTNAIIVVALLLLLIGAMYQRIGIRRDARLVPPPGRMWNIGGRRLHLYCLQQHDDGVPIVFESGIAASSLNWRRVQTEVASFARACAYDRAGYGWSDTAPNPRTARASAADLRQLLRAAQIPPPYVLVGHSFGGYVVLTFAAEHPEDVAGVVLVDAITPEEWMTLSREQRRRLIGGVMFSSIGAALASVGILRHLLNRVLEGEPDVPRRVLRGFGSAATSAVRNVVAEIAKMPEEVRPAIRAHWSRSRSFVTMARHFIALKRSARELHAMLSAEPCPLRDVPLYVLSGAGCSAEQLRQQESVAALSRCGTHVRAVTGGHWVHLDQPEMVREAIRAAVAAVTAGTAGTSPERSFVERARPEDPEDRAVHGESR
jgi:pimeloyl-ACP methyl ester carboxylesterase